MISLLFRTASIGFVGILTIVLLTLLSPVSSADETQHSHALEKVTLQLKWSHQFQFAGYYAAIEQGYYAQEGLEVRLLERDMAKGSIQPVLDGEAEYGVSDAGLLIEKVRGRPVVVVSQIFQHSPLVLISKQSSNINSPYDLRNKKLMVDQIGHSNAPIVAMLNDTLGGVYEVELVELVKLEQQIEAIVQDEIDVLGGYVTNQPFLFQQAGIAVNIIDPRNYGIDFYGDNLFTTENEVLKHPERVEKMIRATLKGWRYALANADEIIHLIRDKYNPNLSLEKLEYEARLTARMISPSEIPLGTIVPRRYLRIAQNYEHAGIIVPGGKWSGFIYQQDSSSQAIKKQSGLNLTAAEEDWLAKHPVLRVMNEPDYAPYDFQVDGVPAGYSIDYIRLIAKKLGVRLEFVQASFSDLMEKARNKEIDVLHSIFKFPKEREEFLNFSKGYKSSVNAIVTRRGEELLNGLGDLKEGSVAAVPGDAAYELVRQYFPELKIVDVANYEESLKAVAFRRADATLMELPVANYLIKKLLINNLSAASELKNVTGADYTYRLATRKDWPELVTILEKAMESLTTRELSVLDNRWLQTADALLVEPQSRSSVSSFLSWQNLVTISLILVVVIAIIMLLFRFVERSRKNPMAYLFTERASRRLPILSTSILILISVSLAWWALTNIKSELKGNMRESLLTVLHTTQEAVNIWVQDQKHELEGIAADSRISQLSLNQLRNYKRGSDLKATPELVGLRNLLFDLHQDKSHLGFFVIAPDGTSIASLRDENIGQQNLIKLNRPDLFLRILLGETVLVPPMPSDISLSGQANIAGKNIPPTMFIATPIKDITGQVIGVLSERFDPHGNFSRINQLGRIGSTGETYSFNWKGELLTKSRFPQELVAANLIKPDEQSILSVKIKDPGRLLSDNKEKVKQSDYPLTLMAKSAIAGFSDHNIEGYRDYRGNRVFGAWTWDDDLGIGMATEIDEVEAMEAYYSARIAIVLILGITLSVSILFTLFTMIVASRANRALKQGHDQLEERVERRTRELKLSEERFDLAMRGANDGLWDWNFKTGEIYYSARWLGMLGYATEERYGNMETWVELCHPDDISKLLEHIDICVDGDKEEFSIEFRMQHKDGYWMPILSRAYVCRDTENNEVTRIVGTHIDLTEQKSAEKALRDSHEITENALNKLAAQEHRYRSLVGNIPGAVYRCDFDENWTMRYLSDYVIQITGYPSSDFIDNKVRSYASVIHPQDTLWVDDAVALGVRSDGFFKVEYRIVNREGDIRWVFERGQVIRDNAGMVKYLDGFLMDTTEQKLAEIKRREIEDRLQKVIDNVPAVVYLKDRQGKYLLINDTYERNTGISREQVMGNTDADIFPVEIADAFMQVDKDVMEKDEGMQIEEKAPHPDGTMHDYWTNKIPIKNEADLIIGILGVSLDISERKKTEDALAEREKSFRGLFEGARDAIIIVDSRQVIDCNDEAVALFGYASKGNVVGAPLLNLIAEKQTNGIESKKYVKKLFNKALREDGLLVEVVQRRSNGSEFIAEVLLNPTEWQGKSVWQGVIRDISGRKEMEKKLQETLQFLQAIMDSASYSIIATEPNGIIKFFNKSAERMLQYKADELVGIDSPSRFHRLDEVQEKAKMLSDGLGRSITAGFEVFTAKADQYDIDEGEWTYVRKDGSEFPVMLSVTPMRNAESKIEGYIGIASDITERKKMESQLIYAKEEAEMASRTKSEFLASMSHEIRTPMNGVLGMLGLLLNTELTFEQRSKLNIAQSSAKSLLSLLNDILDFSKVEAGKLEFESIDFDLSEVLSEVAHSMAVKADEKQIELILDAVEIHHSRVKGDSGRLRQILNNLVGNAIKFTESGQIVIRAALSEISKSQLLLTCSVEDSGIGIPEDKMPLLFERFTQVDASTTRHYGGTGLGLAICKKLTQCMGGDIKVTSQNGKGSCFEFTIILQVSKDSVPVVPLVDIGNLAFLVVDDNQTNREIFQSQLSLWGAEVELAESGQGALNLCSDRIGRPFDVALVDMMMPEMDGETFAKELRKNNRYKQTKLLLLTSMPGEERKEQLQEIGFSGYLAKPVTASELFDAISIASADIQSTKGSPFITKNYLSSVNKKTAGERSELNVQWPESSRILLVDDNQVNQIVAQEMLQDIGLSCEIASNGVKALETLKLASASKGFNLVFMDCQMPELDGYDTSRMIRRGDAGSHHTGVPIVAMTAHAMQGDKEKCLASGMNDYLPKPLEEALLFKTVKKWLIDEPKKETVTQSQVIIGSLEANKVSSSEAQQQLENNILNKSENSQPKLNHVRIPDGLKTIDFEKKKPSIASIPSAYLRALNVYAKQNDVSVEKLISSAKAKNYDEVKHIVHALKGTCGSLGMQPVFELAAKVERTLIEFETIEDEYIDSLVVLLNYSTRDAINIIESNRVETPVRTCREYSDVKAEIVSLLKSSELISTELIDEFKLSAAKVKSQEFIDNVLTQLESFDYESALKIIDQE